MFSKFLYAVACIITSCLFVVEYFIVWICHVLFIDSSVDGHLSCFHLLVFVNSSMNICIQAFVEKYVLISLEYLGMELLGHIVTLFNHLRNL